MTANVEKQMTGSDKLKWVGVACLVAIAAFGNNHFAGETPLFVRVIGVLVVLGGAAFLASITHKGRTAIEFAKESKTEVRKVVWPTRQETIHTTIYIIIVTVIMGLFLMFIDWVVFEAITFLTSRGG